MVLYDAINERFKSVLLYGDDGKYLEERVLLNQMSLFIDLNSLDEYFLLMLKEMSTKVLTNDGRKIINNNLWRWIRSELNEILPDESFAKEFEDTFESKNKNTYPNNRLSLLQNTLIVYFIEDLKSKKMGGIITDEEADKLLDEYKKRLITPSSAVLDDPKANLELESTISIYDTKKNEYKSIVFEKNVK